MFIRFDMIHKREKTPFSRTAAHIFVSSRDAPGAITLNVVWMEKEFDAYKLFLSMYPSIFNSFTVNRTGSAKIAVFTYRSPHFCFLWRRPCDYHPIDNYMLQGVKQALNCLSIHGKYNISHGWKDNSMLA